MPTQFGEQFAYRRIGISNFAVVRRGGVLRLERQRGIVRIVGIVEMHPEEEWSLRDAAEPAQGMIHDIFGAPLDGFVAVGAMAAQVEAGIVDVESAIEAWSGAVERIENQRTDKCPGVIALQMKDVGQIGEIFR